MQPQIFIVDDELTMLSLISLILQRNGFSVVKARDGHAALRLLDSVTPDLFLLDVMMPGMDGIELCGMIRSRAETRNVPIMMLSAVNDTRFIELSYAAGANDYVTKLPSHRDLVAKVRSLLDCDHPAASSA